MTLSFNYSPLQKEELATIASTVEKAFCTELTRLKIDHNLSNDLDKIYVPLAHLLAQASNFKPKPLIIGINGAQGSGKSTLNALLQVVLREGFDVRTCGLSIDDIYLPRSKRLYLAKSVHPLFATRGVPGTHDVALGCNLFHRLSISSGNNSVAIPVFDKSQDDRQPDETWPRVTGPFDLILFEGWCVGAKPQDEMLLREPLNPLEKYEDQDGVWRHYVNHQLHQSYAKLFAKLDLLIMLKIPDFDCVFRWRSLQEQKLAAGVGTDQKTHIMNDSSLRRFIMHYERLTRFMLSEMPYRADVLLNVNHKHRIESMHVFSASH